MITMNPRLVPLVYPGYFWHLDEEVIYSIKIQGILKKLKKQPSTASSRRRGIRGACWHLSYKGKSKFVRHEGLRIMFKDRKEVQFELPLGDYNQHLSYADTHPAIKELRKH